MATQQEETQKKNSGEQRAENSQSPMPNSQGGQNPQNEPGNDAASSGENARVAQLEDQLRRSLAEFDNYRKMLAKRQDEYCETAEAGLVEDLLPVLDEFDAALGSASDETQFRKGMQMLHGNFLKILSSRGLKPIESVGKKFDSALHEVVKAIPAKDGQEDGTIDQELRKGYIFKELVLRHALVIVAQK